MIATLKSECCKMKGTSSVVTALTRDPVLNRGPYPGLNLASRKSYG